MTLICLLCKGESTPEDLIEINIITSKGFHKRHFHRDCLVDRIPELKAMK
jgi:hypothetical protein